MLRYSSTASLHLLPMSIFAGNKTILTTAVILQPTKQQILLSTIKFWKVNMRWKTYGQKS